MCLVNNVKSVDSLLKETKVSCWKWLQIRYPYTGYFQSPILQKRFFPGNNQAQDRKIPLCRADKAEIGAGIHVFRKFDIWTHWNGIIVKCECLIEDLIGANEREAVFNKIHIEKEEFIPGIKKILSDMPNWIHLTDKDDPQVVEYTNLVHEITGKAII